MSTEPGNIGRRENRLGGSAAGRRILLLGERRMTRALTWLLRFLGRPAKAGQEFSGGERNRVHLAKTLTQGANLILLDEPTNDLDVNTLRALEGAVEDFAGCAVIVSHDRWFLDRVATHILAFEDESQTRWIEGNWSDYEADLKRRLGHAADQPHRIKYRSLKR
jgi:ATPase subunit of ABC transporter with duplicated ATPase domains